MEDMQIEDQNSEEVLISNPLPPMTNGENGESNGYVFTGKVVQITNVSTGATLQQIATLFGFLGTVNDIRMYPTEENPQITVKLCYIKYENSEQCGVAQHLTNTVFIDKPLIVVPLNRAEIPEESECRNLIKTINAYASTAGTGFLPQYFPPDDSEGIPGLPPPPIITSTTDPVEIEEIKKTIFVQNIPEGITSEQMMAFFSGVGEIKYLRFVKGETKHCFIEFSNLESVPTALQYNGVLFGGACLKVSYSKSAIVKPESERIASGRNTVRRSTRDAVKRPSSVERDGWDSRTRVFTSRSRSRSKSRRRSRSRDRRRKSRSRTKTPPRRRRSRSRSRRTRRSRSRSTGKPRRRSRSRSKSKSPKKRRSRSKSREKRRRSKRSPSKSPSKSPRRRKKKSKSKSRSPTPHKKKSTRKSSSRSPDRSSKRKRRDKDNKDKDEKRDKEKEKSKKEKSKDKDVEEKELKNLLTKIYTFEEEKEKGKKEKKSEETTALKE